MGINLQLPKLTELKPRITVIGVGGAGGNAVNNMISSGLTGVEFVVANTDSQALLTSSAEKVVQLGVNVTEGLGAGAKPEIGEAAAEEAIDELRGLMSGSHMIFIACGMGGGTGTGAASVIARIAKEMGILVVGIVTKPFQFEGARRMRIAEAGIEELKNYVDTLIVIPNQNLFRIASEKTTFAEAFILADQVLYSGIACIVDLILKEGLINLDFADVRAIMSGMGSAMMGTGEGEGDRRAIIAAEEAITNPLLDGLTLQGARGLLLSIVGGKDLTLYEVDEAASRVRLEVDPDANIIVGASFDDSLGDRVRVSIVASGMSGVDDQSQGIEMPEVSKQEKKPEAKSPPPLPAVDSSKASDAASAAADGGEYQRLLAQDDQGAGQASKPDSASAFGSPPPAPGQASQQQVAGQSLSDAVQHSASAAPPPPKGSKVAPLWQAPGEVTIEQTAPQLQAGADSSAPLSPPAPQNPIDSGQAASTPNTNTAPAPAFVPQAPQNMAQRQRRMPAVEDFPTVGQREYHAKANPAPQQSEQQHARNKKPQGGVAAAPRKAGFFERLTGRRGQAGDATAPNHPPSTYADGYPQEGRGTPHSQAKGASAEPAAGTSKTQEGSKVAGERVDLPMFFNNGRR